MNRSYKYRLYPLEQDKEDLMTEVYCPECEASITVSFGAAKSSVKQHNEWYDHSARVKAVGESIDA